MSKVYVKIRHWNFWYGEYGFTENSCNDEISIYEDREMENRLGYFDITTEELLRNRLKHDLNDENDKEYKEEIGGFIKSSENTYYSYIYPREVCYEDDIARMVTHDAPHDERGNKPVYINVWTKIFKEWNIKNIKELVKILDQKFLHRDVDEIEIVDVPTYEETKASFEEDGELGLYQE